MALFPRIDSPCPYKDRLSEVMAGDFCRMCKRNVVDLTDMNDGARLAFLAGCQTEVCVSYRLTGRLAAAALAVAATTAPVAAAACEDTATSIDYVIVGGLRRPAHAEIVHVAEHATARRLPVVYEDAPAPDTKAPPAKTAEPRQAEARAAADGKAG